MAEILLSVLIFGVLISGMAIGVIVSDKPITGSCGGVAAALGEEDYQCELCGGDSSRCDESLAIDAAPDNLSYQASGSGSSAH